MAVETDVYLPLLLHNNDETLLQLIKGSTRLKYECFDVSANRIVLGANSGGLYVFKRNPNTFLQLIPTKEGCLQRVCLSESENFVAFCTTKNIVCIMELDSTGNGKSVSRYDNLANVKVTDLCWSADSTQTLYIGDNTGRISSLKLSFMSTMSTVVQLSWAITQITCHMDYILVSTIMGCYLCDAEEQIALEIGQNKREGRYGACVLRSSNNHQFKMYCGRPEYSLWEVDTEAQIRLTHKLKQCLNHLPFFEFYSVYNESQIVSEETKLFPTEEISPLPYTKLYDLLGQYVFWHNEQGFFIFDVLSNKVFFWTKILGPVLEVQRFADTIFLRLTGNRLLELAILPIDKFLLKLYFTGDYELCLHAIEAHFETLTGSKKLMRSLQSFSELNTDDPRNVLDRFKEKLKDVTETVLEFNSGIHIVHNRHLSGRLAADEPLPLKRRSERVRRVTETNVPYVNQASYSILQETFAELGTTVTENIKVRWQQLEHKLDTFRGNEETAENAITALSDVDDLLTDESLEEAEPVVKSRKRSSAADIDRILSVVSGCLDTFEESLDQVVQAVDEILEEHSDYCTRNGHDPMNTSYPFEEFSYDDDKNSCASVRQFFERLMRHDAMSAYLAHAVPKMVVEDSDLYPTLLKNTYAKDTLRADLALRRVLTMFAELTNADVFTSINELCLPCVYTSFCYLLTYHGSSETDVHCKSAWPMLYYLNAMWLMLTLDQEDAFRELALKRRVNPRYVSYLLLREGCYERYDRLWLWYTTELIRNDELYWEDEGVLAHTVSAFVRINKPTAGVSCDCAFALPTNDSPALVYPKVGRALMRMFDEALQPPLDEKTVQRFSVLLPLVPSTIEDSPLVSPTSLIFTSLFEELDPKSTDTISLITKSMVGICGLVPCLWRHLANITRLGSLLSSSHYMQLGMVAEMESSCGNREEEVIALMGKKRRLDDGYCLVCDRRTGVKGGVSWTEVALLLMKRLGAKHTISLIKEYADTNLWLDERFYRSALLSTLPQIKSEIKTNVIDAVSSHYNVNPVSENVARKLLEAIKIDRPDLDVSRLHVDKGESHHWGVTVDVEGSFPRMCYSCSLPLFWRSLLLDNNRGMILFSCGHCYHVVCLNSKQSPANCIHCERYGKK